MAYRLAFDIGSKFVKCAIGNDNASIVAVEASRPAISCSEDGFSRNCDPSAYWNDLIDLTRRTIAKAGIPAGDIKYITCSSIRPSCAFVDEQNVPVYIGASFDMRGISAADELEGEFERASGVPFFKATGHFPLLMYPPARYAWYRENEPKSFGRIARYLPLDSWVLQMFGAEEHANVSSAAESGFFDIARRDWCPGWLDVLGLEPDFLPPVVDSGEIVGDVSPAVRRALGLPNTAVVVAGMPDTQAALVGAGCISPGNAAIVVGSTTPVQIITRDPLFDEAARTWTTTLNLKGVVDSYVIEASTGITGQLLAWVSGLLFGHDGTYKEENLRALDAEFDAFDAEEGTRPMEGRDVFAYLGPEPLASSSNSIVPGAFVFPTPGTVDEVSLARRQLVAATFENIQFAARKNLAILQDLVGGTDRVFLLGGMTRSETFCQRFADLVGAPLQSTVEVEATITGLFYTCSVAAGDVTGGADLGKKIASQARLACKMPRKGMDAVLQRRYAKWLTMREKIREL